MAADLKIKYTNAATITITLASLATSATRVNGQQSTAIDNTTNLFLDALVSGKITTGTTPTVNKFIEIWIYASHDETPTYPDVITGSNGAGNFADEFSRNSSMRLGASIQVDATSNQTYWFAPFSVAALFGGVLPRFWGVWVVHDGVAALHATGSNHEIKYTGIHNQSV